ncbi:MAG TPA: nucleotide exchange factor GrpE [Candidatus Saccharimonadales bacterium]|nr:nucleotide exchange factor GrpE [Candidatus Saccharimonadales bacterium]
MADKKAELEQQVGELTADIQRIQADFINYRTRAEQDKQLAITAGKAAAVLKLLPVIDNIDRAVGHIPEELADNQWVKGVSSLGKSLDKSLADMGVTRIEAVGQPFDPNLHEAISAEGEGAYEVVTEELRAGYMLEGQIIRHSMVKVTHQDQPAEQAPAADNDAE